MWAAPAGAEPPQTGVPSGHALMQWEARQTRPAAQPPGLAGTRTARAPAPESDTDLPPAPCADAPPGNRPPKTVTTALGLARSPPRSSSAALAAAPGRTAAPALPSPRTSGPPSPRSPEPAAPHGGPSSARLVVSQQPAQVPPVPACPRRAGCTDLDAQRHLPERRRERAGEGRRARPGIGGSAEPRRLRGAGGTAVGAARDGAGRPLGRSSACRARVRVPLARAVRGSGPARAKVKAPLRPWSPTRGGLRHGGCCSSAHGASGRAEESLQAEKTVFFSSS